MAGAWGYGCVAQCESWIWCSRSRYDFEDKVRTRRSVTSSDECGVCSVW
jgi:hypothetical protein